MSNVIGLIHATVVAIEPMREIFARQLPQVRVLNFLDEGLLHRLNEVGSLTPHIVRRMANLVFMAQDSGAELALLTCSAFSPTVDVVQKMVDIPVLKIDEMMIRKAVESGERIGMIATVAGTYRSTQDLINEMAREKGIKVTVQPVLVEAAFDALLAGQADRHDELLVSKARELSHRSDVIVLAQVSMARAMDKILPQVQVPVLSSPTFAVDRVKEMLA